jgi:endonuclease-3
VRESASQKAARAAAILDGLEATMPEARIELDFTTPLELLVAVMLSAQCTDKRVNLVTPALFRRFRTAAAYGAADVSEVEGFIRTCGLYRNKAKNLVATGRLLAEQHGGQVPIDREVLQALPGVGRKTAGVVTTHLGGTPAFPVDTHIQRLAGRMGLSRAKTPDGVEQDLRALVPEARWTKGHQLLIWHGRRTCAARAPACDRCAVQAHCPRKGVKAR